MNFCSEKSLRKRSYFACIAVVALSGLISACSGESAEKFIGAAKLKLQLNDANAAVIQLKNALQKEPGNKDARFLLGKVMLNTGDIVGAIVELQKAQDLGYSFDEVSPLLAQAQFIQGPAEKVISKYGSITLSTVDADAALQTVLASAYIEASKYSEAQAALARALATKPDYIPAQLLRVSMLARNRDFVTADKVLADVLARAPQNSQAWQIKGDIAVYRGELTVAKRDFQAAVERDKLNLAAHTAGIWLSLGTGDFQTAEKQLVAMRSVASRNPQTQLFSALLAFERGELKVAYEQCLQLLKIAPDNVKVLHLTGAIELRSNSLIKAESTLTKALQLEPEQSKVRLLLAQTLLRLGEQDKAMRNLSPLLNESAQSWEANALMAEALMQKGESKPAEAYFLKAAKLNPKDSRSRTALAMAEVSRGRVEQGFEVLRTISVADAGPTADLALINALLVKKDYERALHSLKTLEIKIPNSPLPSYLRGQVALQRQQKDQARSAFEAALKIDPSYFPAAANLASMEVDDGKADLAPKYFERILAADPKNVRASLGLIALRVKAGAKQEDLIAALSKLVQANPNEPTPRLMLVRLHLDRNDLKAAKSAAQDGVSSNPDDVQLLDLLGKIQYQLGDYNQAISTYNKIIALQPNEYQSYLRLADIHLALKDSATAVQNLKKALNFKPDLYAAQRSLMLIDLTAGRVKEALATAKTVQAQHVGEAAGFMLEGDIHANQRKWMLAANSYRSAFEKNPSTELVVKLQNVLIADGKIPEAKKLESEWLKSHVDDSVYLYYLGDLALARGEYESAQKWYEAVLRLKPENSAALNNLAWLLNKKKSPTALTIALKANALAPKQSAYLDTLADIYWTNGDPAKAIETQRTAVELAPNLHRYRLHLARLYIDNGNKDLARKELTLLMNLGEKFADQVEVSKLLSNL